MADLRPRAQGQQGGGVYNPARGVTGPSLLGGAGFNPLSAGNKSYGPGQVGAPNVGPVQNKQGYVERDLRLAAQRQALQNLTRGTL